jgi:hypothetical protein
LFNNTVDGVISNSGAVSVVARNNFYKTFTGNATLSNNININDITPSAYFENYPTHDYRLKSTAVNAIGKGVSVGLNTDMSGNPVSGTPDIGAYQYKTSSASSTNNPPVIADQDFAVYPENFKNNLVGNIQAQDIDAGQTLTYSITSGNASGLFVLNNQNGELKTSTANIFTNDDQVFKLNVQVTDNGTNALSSSAVVNITIVGNSRTVYIDPNNQSDPLKNGSLAHPFSSWKEVTWKNGNVYLQKRGTTALIESIVIGASNVTLDAYDKGDTPGITGEANTYVISGYDKSDINIRNLHLKGENTLSCIYFLGNACDNITVEHCVLEGQTNAVRIVDGGHIIIKYNVFLGENEGVYSTSSNTSVYYNIFKNNQTAINISGNLSAANIYNNIFVDNIQSVSVTYADLTLYNNIFYLTNAADKAVKSVSNKLVSDNNIYFPEQASFFTVDNTSYSKLDQLQKTLKIDRHSFNADPLFVDLIRENYALQGNSPGINAGVNLNLPLDFLGQNVPCYSLPDIGAIEYTGPIVKHNVAKSHEPAMKIYPNPSTGPVNLELSFDANDSTVESLALNNNTPPVITVFDMAGRVVFSKLGEITENLIRDNLDLSDLPIGIYNVTIQTLNSMIVKKLILKR